ncbi:MAG: hypothetical protein KDD59_14305, partial [Bdellovibrionales bacterium]|nr:hypothetical protein [Bdellovibrionales bacterium]
MFFTGRLGLAPGEGPLLKISKSEKYLHELSIIINNEWHHEAQWRVLSLMELFKMKNKILGFVFYN